MKQLPDSVKHYKTTPKFNEQNTPKGLLKDHTTATGTWAKLVVLKGEIEYTIQTSSPEVNILSQSTSGIIEPQVKHKIKPLGEVEFHIEFYK